MTTVQFAMDEAEWLDGALSLNRREPIHAARQRLLATLHAAAQAEPANDFIAGQRIRFLIDQQDMTGALDAVRACTASPWWCGVLKGYVHYYRKEFALAESAFDAGRAVMSPADRCTWNDHAVLMDSAAHTAYKRLSCAARDSANAVLWWLADPLFSAPGNERRVAQDARRVLIALRSALERDERYNWRTSFLRVPRAEMIHRYGWPSYVFWPGPDQEREYGAPIFVNENDPRIAELHTSYEYNQGRQHLVPAARAILDPWSSSNADWTINSPPGMDRPTMNDPLWWPEEHYAAPFRLLQLGDGQSVVLRRQSDVLLATAVNLDPVTTGRPHGTLVEGKLVIAARPDAAPIAVPAAAVVVGDVLRARTPITAAGLVGFEIAPSTGFPEYPAARSRFGVRPPPPLRELNGALAISDPVLLHVRGDDALPTLPDSALNQMLGTTRISAGSKLGIYWETYGFSATDSVEIAVWIERYTRQGILRRFTTSLRVTEDLNTPVAVGWTETQPGPQTRVLEGAVPILARSVTVDISRLPAGEYWLDIAVRKVGADAPVRGRRTFVIE